MLNLLSACGHKRFHITKEYCYLFILSLTGNLFGEVKEMMRYDNVSAMMVVSISRLVFFFSVKCGKNVYSCEFMKVKTGVVW